MSTARVVREFYAALASRDVPALLNLLDEDVAAWFTLRLPNDWGGLHRGRDALLQTWSEITQCFDGSAVPAELLVVGNRVIVFGEYRGSVTRDRRPFAAAFVHVFRVVGCRIVELRQTTDSAAWHDLVGVGC